jgi:predicted RNA-binding protein with RPS1 domain
VTERDLDMHEAGAVPCPRDDELLAEGTRVRGRVVCHHQFGLGVLVADHGQYGHVDVPYVRDGFVRGVDDYPPIGSDVRAHVLGYAGADRQLRLSLRT